MFHRTEIIGNLGSEPEFKELPSGHKVCNFSVAVNTVTGKGDQKKKETTWYRVAAWGAQAEPCAKFLSKGKQVFVEGRVFARAYESNGEWKASLELNASRVNFLGQETHRGDGFKPAPQQEGSQLNQHTSQLDQIPF